MGYVFNYDLIKQARINGNLSVSKVLRHLPTTPENTAITEVLEQMIHTRVPMVVVVDEYGGTSGIITDKDIYEELFGTVRDEIDNVADNMISKMPDGHYKVDGKTTTYDFERFFHEDIKSFEADDAVTLSGYVIDNFPHIKNNDTIKIGDLKLTIRDYENSYIDWFEVSPVENQGSSNTAK